MPLRDSVFYPIIGIVVALMVMSSFYIGWQQPKCGPFGGANGPDDYSLIILKGQDLCRMDGSLGYEIELEEEVLTIRAEADAVYADVRENAHFRLGPDLVTVYSGHKLRISFTVKPTNGAGAEAFEFKYGAGNAGDTGWTRFDLKEDWETYTAEVNIPRRLVENSEALNYLSVRPVVPDKTRGIELSEIRFRRLGQW